MRDYSQRSVCSVCSVPCRFQFTEQLVANGHSALEILVYLAVQFYYIVFVYACINPSRFPVSILSNTDFALYS